MGIRQMTSPICLPLTTATGSQRSCRVSMQNVDPVHNSHCILLDPLRQEIGSE